MNGQTFPVQSFQHELGAKGLHPCRWEGSWVLWGPCWAGSCEMYGPSLGAYILSRLTPSVSSNGWSRGHWELALWRPTRATSLVPHPQHSNHRRGRCLPLQPGETGRHSVFCPPQSQRSPTWMQKPPPSQLPEVPGSNPSSSGKHPSSWAGLGCGLQRGKISIQGSGPPEHFPSWYCLSFCTAALLKQETDKATILAHPSSSLLLSGTIGGAPKPLRPPGLSSGAPPTGGHPNRPFSSY